MAITVDKKEFLKLLECCTPGLNAKESIEQSNCFCFDGRKIKTFNDEIYCEIPMDFELYGAVPSRPLLDLLRGMTELEVEIHTEDNKLIVRGDRKTTRISMTQDIVLDTTAVEEPTEWIELPPAFADGLPLVAEVAAEESDILELTCVHFTPRGFEASDRSQAIRFVVATGLKERCLIRRTSCKAITGYGITDICDTQSWLHWRAYSGLRVSVRKIQGEFPEGITQIIREPAKAIVEIPASVSDSLKRAKPFLAEGAGGKRVEIMLSSDVFVLTAKNAAGLHEESKDVTYDGPPLHIGVQPKSLIELLRHAMRCEITANAIRVKGDCFIHAVALEDLSCLHS